MLGQLLTVSQRGQQIETEFYCISHYYCMILLFNDIQYQSFVHREYIAIYSLDFYAFRNFIVIIFQVSIRLAV